MVTQTTPRAFWCINFFSWQMWHFHKKGGFWAISNLKIAWNILSQISIKILVAWSYKLYSYIICQFMYFVLNYQFCPHLSFLYINRIIYNLRKRMYKNTLTLCLCRYWPIDTREKRYNFYRQTIQYANGKLIHRLCLLWSMLRGIFECKLSLSWCGLNFKVKDHNFPSIIISGYIQDLNCSLKTVYYAWQVNFHFLTLHMFNAWKK